MINYTDHDGNPLTLDEWGALYEDIRSRMIAEVLVEDWGFVRVVYVGMSIHQDIEMYEPPFGVACYNLYPVDALINVMKRFTSKDAAIDYASEWGTPTLTGAAAR